MHSACSTGSSVVLPCEAPRSCAFTQIRPSRAWVTLSIPTGPQTVADVPRPPPESSGTPPSTTHALGGIRRAILPALAMGSAPPWAGKLNHCPGDNFAASKPALPGTRPDPEPHGESVYTKPHLQRVPNHPHFRNEEKPSSEKFPTVTQQVTRDSEIRSISKTCDSLPHLCLAPPWSLDGSGASRGCCSPRRRHTRTLKLGDTADGSRGNQRGCQEMEHPSSSPERTGSVQTSIIDVARVSRAS